ncbi:hypothetical protein [Streptomyces sp. SM11]|uniref:hypothetical protein n=1 Tax=Streptomyces sp. SM11 TaxID=565557 RepID=UPI000CD4F242|nr:hypothetical protein [Streptomyces sp. SM11]
MPLRLPLTKFAAVLALVAAPAVGVATVVGAGAGALTDTTIASVADGTASSQPQGSTPSPSSAKDTTGWD